MVQNFLGYWNIVSLFIRITTYQYSDYSYIASKLSLNKYQYDEKIFFFIILLGLDVISRIQNPSLCFFKEFIINYLLYVFIIINMSAVISKSSSQTTKSVREGGCKAVQLVMGVRPVHFILKSFCSQF